jgi:beta-glucosidase-like glycosyl hydrolase
MLDYLRTTLAFDGLVVTDAFIMAGATAAAPEGVAAVAAVNAGCDMLLYPTDWADVVRELERVDPDRAAYALARYQTALSSGAASRGQPSDLDDTTVAEHQKFADGLADRAVHLVRGQRPQLGNALSVTIVDDDVGGPYSIAPRDVFHATLRDAGLGLRAPGPRPVANGVSRVVLVYAEPRSWKGRADLGPQSLAKLERLVPGASLVILFAHPRLAAQVPGDVPVLCAWHGQALMQRAAARWVLTSVR